VGECLVSVSSDSREYCLFRDDSPCDTPGQQRADDVLVFKAFGLAIGIGTDDAQVMSQLLDRMPPGSTPTSQQPQRLYTLHSISRTLQPARAGNHAQIAETRDERAAQVLLTRSVNLADVLEVFESDLQLQVAEMCSEKVFVHAGVVGWNGKAIVVPGKSCAGKTTLITGLVRAGATYYSDEYAVFDDEGRVHSYSRPPRIRTAEGKSRIEFEPEMFEGERELEPLPLGYIVVTQYQTGARWQPRRLSPGQAVLALLQNTVAIRRRPDSCLAALSRASSSAITVQSARGEADETALLLLSEIEKDTRELSRVGEALQLNTTLWR
jgi:hypothetical protein